MRRLLAGGLALVLSLVGLVGLATSASSAATIVISQPQPSGTTASGEPYFRAGSYTLAIGYAAVSAGEEIIVKAPNGVTIPDEALQKSAANQLIESVTRAANGDIVIVFKDAATSQGWLDLEFTIEQIESATPWTDEWRVNDVTSPIDVVIVPSGQTPAVVQTNAGKSTSWTDLSRFVSVDSDGLVQIDEAGLSAVTFTYTITADSKEAREVVITDTMSNLVLVEGSLVGKKTVWNSYGLEPVETVNLPGLPVLSGSTSPPALAGQETQTGVRAFVRTPVTPLARPRESGPARRWWPSRC